jgi:predicted nucleic acid-binding Zn ribbon protein
MSGITLQMISSLKFNKGLRSIYKRKFIRTYRKSFVKLRDNDCSEKELEELRKQFRERKKHNKRVQKYLISFLIFLTVLFFYFLFIF